MQTSWTKLPNGTLAPDDNATIEWLQKVKTGDGLMGEFKRPRNYAFHKKWFALVQFAFEQWEPADGAPEKSFERFRKEVTMLAGYYVTVPSLKGGVRYEAKSISFASMDEAEFGELYESTVAALLNWVLRTYTRDDIDRVSAEIARFM